MLDVDKLDLGRNNEVKLGSLIIKNRIQEVFKDLLNSHLNWLRENYKRASKMSQSELQDTANRLKLKNQMQKKTKNELKPIALPSQEVKKWLEKIGSKKPKRFIYFVRELCGNNPPSFALFGLEKDTRDNKTIILGDRKAKENWARTTLLLQIIKKLLETDSSINLSKTPSETEITEKLNQKIKIRFKLPQGWRKYVRYEKSFFEKLIQVYYKKDFSGTLPLLQKNNSSKKEQSLKEMDVSIQALKKTLDQERPLVMQSIFKMEKDFIKKNGFEQNDLEGNYNYLPFEKVLNKSDIDSEVKEDIKKIRNACFHNDIWDKKFSEAPEPLQSIYSDLEKQQKKKRKKQQNTGYKKKNLIPKNKQKNLLKTKNKA